MKTYFSDLVNGHHNTPKLRTFLFTVFFLYLVVVSFIPAQAYDSFWHLAIGQEILNQGLSFFAPLKDSFSFTHNGTEYYSTYLFDVLFAFLVDILGYKNGFVGLRVVCLGLFSLALWFLFKQSKIDWRITIIVLPAILFFTTSRIFNRPELFALALTITTLILYQRAANNFSSTNLAGISILLLFWINFHTPILGYIIFFGLFVDKGLLLLRGKADFSWTFWIIWGLFLVSIGFINPSARHFLIDTLSFDEHWYKYIIEYKTVTPTENIDYYFTLAIYVTLWAIALYLRKFGYFIVSIILSIYAYKYVRLYPVTAIINLTLLAILLNEIDVFNRLKKAKKSLRILFSIMMMVIVPMFIWRLAEQIQNVSDGYAHFFYKYPVKAIEYLKKQKPGPILNSYGLGGYIIYTAGNKYPVYIDGRTNILYPVDFMTRYYTIIRNSAELSKETDKYNIKYALFDNNYQTYKTLMKTEKYQLDFMAENHFLMKTGDSPNFPVTGKYLAKPACWKKGAIPKIELNRSEILPTYSGLRTILELLKAIKTDPDKKRVFIQSRADMINSLLAYITYDLKKYDVALGFFAAIKSKAFTDIFMMANILIQQDRLTDAEKILHYATEEKAKLQRKKMTFVEEFLLLTLLQEIKKEQELVIFKDSYFEEQVEKFKPVEKRPEDITKELPDIICRMYK